MNVPTQVFSQTTPSSASSTQKAGTTSGTKAGKLRILGEKVKGEVATIVLGIPGAGRLRLTGKYMKTDTRNLLRAQRLVVRMKLAKAGIASLAHGHRRNLKVHLSATFTPTKGARTSAGAALTFHSRSA